MTPVPKAAHLPLLLLVLPAVLLPADPAAAHTQLTATAPANGATAPATTDRLVLSFDEPVRADLARIAVTGPGGATAALGAPAGTGTDVVQRLRAPLPAGAWTAAYRVLSADGHPVSGTFAFTVVPARRPTAPTPMAAVATPPEAGPPVAEPTSRAVADRAPADSDMSPVLALGVGAVVIGALAAAVVLVRRRRADDGT